MKHSFFSVVLVSLSLILQAQMGFSADCDLDENGVRWCVPFGTWPSDTNPEKLVDRCFLGMLDHDQCKAVTVQIGPNTVKVFSGNALRASWGPGIVDRYFDRVQGFGWDNHLIYSYQTKYPTHLFSSTNHLLDPIVSCQTFESTKTIYYKIFQGRFDEGEKKSTNIELRGISFLLNEKKSRSGLEEFCGSLSLKIAKISDYKFFCEDDGGTRLFVDCNEAQLCWISEAAGYVRAFD